MSDIMVLGTGDTNIWSDRDNRRVPCIGIRLVFM